MKISWILLTHNRIDVAEKCLVHNINHTGCSFDEIDFVGEFIWVDNGSRDIKQSFLDLISVIADTSIRNAFNLGVAKGYNQGLSMATGDFIIITGCDRMMPDNWLRMSLDAFKRIPNTGIISFYHLPIDCVPERKRSEPYEYVYGPINLFNGDKGILEIQECMPMEAKILKRSLHREIGYLKQDLGLYGWEDVLWGERAEKVTREHGLINYQFPQVVATHIGDEGSSEWKGNDSKEYYEFKQRESNDPKKKEVCESYRKEGWPYYNPFV